MTTATVKSLNGRRLDLEGVGVVEVPFDAEITLNGAPAKMSRLLPGDEATLTVVHGKPGSVPRAKATGRGSGVSVVGPR